MPKIMKLILVMEPFAKIGIGCTWILAYNNEWTQVHSGCNLLLHNMGGVATTSIEGL